jgi:hypothetical protein
MKIIQLNEAYTITLYDSIKDLPIYLMKKFENYILQAEHIGDGFEDIDTHFIKLVQLNSAGQKDSLFHELMNLRSNIFSMVDKVDYKSLAFACLLHKVNDEEVKNYDPGSAEALLDVLSSNGLNCAEVEQYLDEVKKKLMPKDVYYSLKSLK